MFALDCYGVQGDNSVCLADVCDMFRCDIVSHSLVPDYWDVALCLEDEMKSLRRRCEVSTLVCHRPCFLSEVLMEACIALCLSIVQRMDCTR